MLLNIFDKDSHILYILVYSFFATDAWCSVGVQCSDDPQFVSQHTNVHTLKT